MLFHDQHLSNVYSNHCIRVTWKILLNKSGFFDNHIIAISGHKGGESTTRVCSDNVDKQQKEKMCVYIITLILI